MKDLAQPPPKPSDGPPRAVVPTDLSKSLRVIGAGYPRTGTSSLTLALEILFEAPVMHSGSSCLEREESFIKTWIEIMNNSGTYNQPTQESTRRALRSLCAGYVGITDAPGALFIRELVEEFPDAIVICTQRNPEKWLKSFQAVGESIMMLKTLNLVLSPLPSVRYFGSWINALMKR
ncbi:hypothetical protein QQS21_007457 [Conoideocrella luteorostrata]|uniref:P-loop containing nucleoside triphosphate hydrolase protein n=1 Tax=Conoideocrella luteorostrata TaxID=1105319 RepID=A0AAJ0CNF2_9HYPO|nr:hypothetical protein QQS21_007457 [Conoideocrella luteorostrata]